MLLFFEKRQCFEKHPSINLIRMFKGPIRWSDTENNHVSFKTVLANQNAPFNIGVG